MKWTCTRSSTRSPPPLGDETARPFRQLLDWYVCLLGLLREKKISLGRLRRMLFGARTERSDNVLPSTATSSGEVDPRRQSLRPRIRTPRRARRHPQVMPRNILARHAAGPITAGCRHPSTPAARR